MAAVRRSTHLDMVIVAAGLAALIAAAIGFWAATHVWQGQSWQLEIDGSVLGNTESCNSCDDDTSTYFAMAAHWLDRGEGGTWGIFGGLAHAQHQNSSDASGNFFGGVEYAHFSGANTTLFGQLGGTIAVMGDTSDGWQEGIFGRLGGRYFMSETSKIEVDGMVGWGRFDSDDHEGITANWGVEFENQFSGPFSGFIAYRGYFVEDSTTYVWDNRDDHEVVSHAIMVGFRVAVNSENLLQRERTGAGTFDIPDFHRAMAWPDTLN